MDESRVDMWVPPGEILKPKAYRPPERPVKFVSEMPGATVELIVHVTIAVFP
jgi:hypothetical protein